MVTRGRIACPDHRAPGARAVVWAVVLASAALGASTADGTIVEANAGPANTSPPVVTGDARQGARLSGVPGAWTATGTAAYTYQWYRCDAAGAHCSSVHGATIATYTLVAADAGKTVGLAVKATDSAGATTAYASLVGPIAPTTSTLYATAQPKITGTPAQGATLQVDNGTWNATAQYAYSWQRCNVNGRICLPIANATTASYQATVDDVGHALVAVVEGTLGTVKASAFSVAAVVNAGASLPAGATPLDGGKYSIPVTSVSLPERLILSGVAFTPATITSRTPFKARFTVTDTRGYVVRDALVLAQALPFGLVSTAKEQATTTDGSVTLTFTPTSKFRAVKGAIVFFVRARKTGDDPLAGVSTSRLVQVRTAAP
jgi:hypothetical protein